jgi:hypothetical protein
MDEKWKSIRGYEELYEISDLGRVRSLAKKWKCGKGKTNSKNETILKLYGKEYLYVYLYKKGKRICKKVHHLVFDNFSCNKRNSRILVVDHINNIKTDNRIDNLQLLTQRENVAKGKLQYKKSSIYTGASWAKKSQKWQSHIKINGKSNHLGLFDNEYDAHLAYQKALAVLKK